MRVPFTKIHSQENDFVILDALRERLYLNTQQIRKICNRKTGIGCDQLLVIEAPYHPDALLFYRIYNTDGSEAAQCINGGLAIARYARDHAFTKKDAFLVQNATGVMQADLVSDMTKLTIADITVPKIPDSPHIKAGNLPLYSISIEGKETQVGIVQLGNMHAIFLRKDQQQFNLTKIGKILNSPSYFPEGINVSAVTIENENNIHLRTYERGVGCTRACGSAAAATTAFLRLYKKVSEEVNVHMPGGRLKICKTNAAIDIQGTPQYVFTGTFELG